MPSGKETAYEHLSAKLVHSAAETKVKVVAPLKKNGKKFFLEVRTAAINSVAI
jgi:hypothetical protein